MILVFDPRGTIFAKLRELELGLPLWRVDDLSRLVNVEHAALGIVAAYQNAPWDLLPAGRDGFGVMVVTERYASAEAAEAIDRGLLGYIDAGMEPLTLRRAILGVLAGEPGFERRTIGAWMRDRRSCVAAHRGVAALTERQRQVVALVAQGLGDKEIAQRLGIATGTAQKHVTNILDRLGVTNRAAAAATTCVLLLERRLSAAPTPEPDAAVAPANLYSLPLHARTA